MPNQRDAAKEIERLRTKSAGTSASITSRTIPKFPMPHSTGSWNRLKELEAQYPSLVTPDSPTVRVGGARPRGLSKSPPRHADGQS